MTAPERESIAQRKAELRRSLRQARLSLTDRPARSERILRRLQASNAYRDAERIVGFVGVASEVQTETWVHSILTDGKRLGLVWCDDDHLQITEVKSHDDLEPGAFDIPEPVKRLRSDTDRTWSPAVVDLLLVPALGVTETGERIGQGRGFYDRLIADVGPNTVTLGVVFEVQVVDAIPTAAHDKRLDGFVTEERAVWCNPREVEKPPRTQAD